MQSHFYKKYFAFWPHCRTQFLWHSGTGIDLKEKLSNLGWSGDWKFPPQKIKSYAIWGYPEVNVMEINSLFCRHYHWLKPPQRLPDESPHTSRLQMTDRHPKHHLAPISLPKVRSCDVWNQDCNCNQDCNIMQPSADVFQASFPHKLSLPAQLVFFLHKVASFIILKSMSLYVAVKYFLFKFMYKCSFGYPTGFSRLQPTRLIRLPFNDTHSQLQSSNILPRFTTWVTVMVNLSLSKLFLFLSQNMGQEWLHSSQMPACDSNSQWLCSQLSN